MTTKIVSPTWISARSKECEFQDFIGATSAEEAIKKATARCLKNDVEVCSSLLSTLKEEYVGFCRTKWGLPVAAGAAL